MPFPDIAVKVDNCSDFGDGFLVFNIESSEMIEPRFGYSSANNPSILSFDSDLIRIPSTAEISFLAKEIELYQVTKSIWHICYCFQG